MERVDAALREDNRIAAGIPIPPTVMLGDTRGSAFTHVIWKKRRNRYVTRTMNPVASTMRVAMDGDREFIYDAIIGRRHVHEYTTVAGRVTEGTRRDENEKIKHEGPTTVPRTVRRAGLHWECVGTDMATGGEYNHTKKSSC